MSHTYIVVHDDKAIAIRQRLVNARKARTKALDRMVAERTRVDRLLGRSFPIPKIGVVDRTQPPTTLVTQDGEGTWDVCLRWVA